MSLKTNNNQNLNKKRRTRRRVQQKPSCINLRQQFKDKTLCDVRRDIQSKVINTFKRKTIRNNTLSVKDVIKPSLDIKMKDEMKDEIIEVYVNEDKNNEIIKLYEETINEETINEETINEETINEETINEETIKEVTSKLCGELVDEVNPTDFFDILNIPDTLDNTYILL